MTRKNRTDIGWGIFFLFFAILVWIVVPYQIPVSARPTAMGPRFFPRVISIILGFTSAGLIISTLLKQRKELRSAGPREPQQESGQKGLRERLFNRQTLKDEARAVLVLVSMTVYALLMPVIGFILSSSLTGGAVLVILGARKWYYYLILFGSVYLIFYIFRFHLYVQLP